MPKKRWVEICDDLSHGFVLKSPDQQTPVSVFLEILQDINSPRDAIVRLDIKSPVTIMHRVGMRRRVATPDRHVTSSSSSSPRMSHPSWHHSGSTGPNREALHSHAPMNDWIPSEEDVSTRSYRCWRRRIFMIITEPDSSVLSAAFYVILMSAIFVVNIIMVMQTMESWQYTPKNCLTCGGNVTYVFEDDLALLSMNITTKAENSDPVCECPPEPQTLLVNALDRLMIFFVVEWCTRVVTFVAPDPAPDPLHQLYQWLDYMVSPSTVMDALATFPYYLETIPNSLVSLRLLRLLRIFQLVRLGQYNTMFVTLTNVMGKSLNYLRLLILMLAFGGAFFGSILYWVERGTWSYYEPSGKYLFVRLSVDGVTEEPSPFRSIPDAFWWFMVTATTVGYGDYYPTSPIGKCIACCAMLMGVLVIAFPVSVFSDLWSQELKQVKGFEDLNYSNTDDDNEDDEAVYEEEAYKEGDDHEEPSLFLSSRPLEAPITEETPLRQSQLTGRLHDHHGGDMVMMSKEDFKDLVACIYNIKENQRRVHGILRKYRIVDEADASRHW